MEINWEKWINEELMLISLSLSVTSVSVVLSWNRVLEMNWSIMENSCYLVNRIIISIRITSTNQKPNLFFFCFMFFNLRKGYLKKKNRLIILYITLLCSLLILSWHYCLQSSVELLIALRHNDTYKITAHSTKLIFVTCST